ncbi:MAG: DUF5615 family PIN-like protein [Chloroflexi bacterium]|nr:DUF5615 family PIN-like protein [Chloroflexota bacterium]
MAHLYLDHCVASQLALLIRSAGKHDVTTARDLGLARSPDPQQLLRAASEAWPLVTHNRDDYIMLHDAWVRWTSAWHITPRHSGILIILQDRARLRMAALIDQALNSGAVSRNVLLRWFSNPTGSSAAWHRWETGGVWLPA